MSIVSTKTQNLGLGANYYTDDVYGTPPPNQSRPNTSMLQTTFDAAGVLAGNDRERFKEIEESFLGRTFGSTFAEARVAYTALFAAWEKRIKSGKFGSSRELLKDIWENDPVAKDGIALLGGFYDALEDGAKKPSSFEELVKNHWGDHATLADIIGYEETQDAAKLRQQLGIITVNGDRHGAAGAMGLAAFYAKIPAASADMKYILEEDGGIFQTIRDSLKGFTEPQNFLATVIPFAAAEIATTAIMAKLAPKGIEALTFLSRLGMGTLEQIIKAGGFTVFGKGYSYLFSTNPVDLSANAIASEWATLAMSFGLTRMVGVPLQGLRNEMARTKLFGLAGAKPVIAAGKAVMPLKTAGEAIFKTAENLTTAGAFFLGNRLGFEFGWRPDDPKFFAEWMNLNTFILTTRLANKATGGWLHRKTFELRTRPQMDAAKEIAGQLAGKDTKVSERLASGIFNAHVRGDISAGELVDFGRLFSKGEGDSIDAVIGANKILDAATKGINVTLLYDGRKTFVTNPDVKAQYIAEQMRLKERGVRVPTLLLAEAANASGGGTSPPSEPEQSSSSTGPSVRHLTTREINDELKAISHRAVSGDEAESRDRVREDFYARVLMTAVHVLQSRFNADSRAAGSGPTDELIHAAFETSRKRTVRDLGDSTSSYDTDPIERLFRDYVQANAAGLGLIGRKPVASLSRKAARPADESSAAAGLDAEAKTEKIAGAKSKLLQIERYAAETTSPQLDALPDHTKPPSLEKLAQTARALSPELNKTGGDEAVRAALAIEAIWEEARSIYVEAHSPLDWERARRTMDEIRGDLDEWFELHDGALADGKVSREFLAAAMQNYIAFWLEERGGLKFDRILYSPDTMTNALARTRRTFAGQTTEGIGSRVAFLATSIVLHVVIRESRRERVGGRRKSNGGETKPAALIGTPEEFRQTIGPELAEEFGRFTAAIKTTQIGDARNPEDAHRLAENFEQLFIQYVKFAAIAEGNGTHCMNLKQGGLEPRHVRDVFRHVDGARVRFDDRVLELFRRFFIEKVIGEPARSEPLPTLEDLRPQKALVEIEVTAAPRYVEAPQSGGMREFVANMPLDTTDPIFQRQFRDATGMTFDALLEWGGIRPKPDKMTRAILERLERYYQPDQDSLERFKGNHRPDEKGEIEITNGDWELYVSLCRLLDEELVTTEPRHSNAVDAILPAYVFLERAVAARGMHVDPVDFITAIYAIARRMRSEATDGVIRFIVPRDLAWIPWPKFGSPALADALLANGADGTPRAHALANHAHDASTAMDYQTVHDIARRMAERSSGAPADQEYLLYTAIAGPMRWAAMLDNFIEVRNTSGDIVTKKTRTGKYRFDLADDRAVYSSINGKSRSAQDVTLSDARLGHYRALLDATGRHLDILTALISLPDSEIRVESEDGRPVTLAEMMPRYEAMRHEEAFRRAQLQNDAAGALSSGDSVRGIFKFYRNVQELLELVMRDLRARVQLTTPNGPVRILIEPNSKGRVLSAADKGLASVNLDGIPVKEGSFVWEARRVQSLIALRTAIAEALKDGDLEPGDIRDPERIMAEVKPRWQREPSALAEVIADHLELVETTPAPVEFENRVRRTVTARPRQIERGPGAIESARSALFRSDVFRSFAGSRLTADEINQAVDAMDDYFEKVRAAGFYFSSKALAESVEGNVKDPERTGAVFEVVDDFLPEVGAANSKSQSSTQLGRGQTMSEGEIIATVYAAAFPLGRNAEHAQFPVDMALMREIASNHCASTGRAFETALSDAMAIIEDYNRRHTANRTWMVGERPKLSLPDNGLLADRLNAFSLQGRPGTAPDRGSQEIARRAYQGLVRQSPSSTQIGRDQARAMLNAQARGRKIEEGDVDFFMGFVSHQAQTLARLDDAVTGRIPGIEGLEAFLDGRFRMNPATREMMPRLASEYFRERVTQATPADLPRLAVLCGGSALGPEHLRLLEKYLNYLEEELSNHVELTALALREFRMDSQRPPLAEDAFVESALAATEGLLPRQRWQEAERDRAIVREITGAGQSKGSLAQTAHHAYSDALALRRRALVNELRSFEDTPQNIVRLDSISGRIAAIRDEFGQDMTAEERDALQAAATVRNNLGKRKRALDFPPPQPRPPSPPKPPEKPAPLPPPTEPRPTGSAEFDTKLSAANERQAAIESAIQTAQNERTQTKPLFGRAGPVIKGTPSIKTAADFRRASAHGVKAVATERSAKLGEQDERLAKLIEGTEIEGLNNPPPDASENQLDCALQRTETLKRALAAADRERKKVGILKQATEGLVARAKAALDEARRQLPMADAKIPAPPPSGPRGITFRFTLVEPRTPLNNAARATLAEILEARALSLEKTTALVPPAEGTRVEEWMEGGCQNTLVVRDVFGNEVQISAGETDARLVGLESLTETHPFRRLVLSLRRVTAENGHESGLLSRLERGSRENPGARAVFGELLGDLASDEPATTPAGARAKVREFAERNRARLIETVGEDAAKFFQLNLRAPEPQRDETIDEPLTCLRRGCNSQVAKTEYTAETHAALIDRAIFLLEHPEIDALPIRDNRDGTRSLFWVDSTTVDAEIKEGLINIFDIDTGTSPRRVTIGETSPDENFPPPTGKVDHMALRRLMFQIYRNPRLLALGKFLTEYFDRTVDERFATVMDMLLPLALDLPGEPAKISLPEFERQVVRLWRRFTNGEIAPELRRVKPEILDAWIDRIAPESFTDEQRDLIKAAMRRDKKLYQVLAIRYFTEPHIKNRTGDETGKKLYAQMISATLADVLRQGPPPPEGAETIADNFPQAVDAYVQAFRPEIIAQGSRVCEATGMRRPHVAFPFFELNSKRPPSPPEIERTTIAAIEQAADLIRKNQIEGMPSAAEMIDLIPESQDMICVMALAQESLPDAFRTEFERIASEARSLPYCEDGAPVNAVIKRLLDLYIAHHPAIIRALSVKGRDGMSPFKFLTGEVDPTRDEIRRWSQVDPLLRLTDTLPAAARFSRNDYFGQVIEGYEEAGRKIIRIPNANDEDRILYRRHHILMEFERHFGNKRGIRGCIALDHLMTFGRTVDTELRGKILDPYLELEEALEQGTLTDEKRRGLMAAFVEVHTDPRYIKKAHEVLRTPIASFFSPDTVRKVIRPATGETAAHYFTGSDTPWLP